MIEAGIAALDAAARGAGPRELSRRRLGGRPRGDPARRSSGSEFFQTIRGGLVTGLYNQKEVWPLFGYEGESFSPGRLHRPRLRRHRLALRRARARTMAAPFDLNDDSVVVIIGTGAGGGTLGQRAGAEGRQRSSPSRPAGGTSPRTSSTTSGRASPSSPGSTCAPPRGDWRVAQGLPEPAGLDRQGGRRHHHALGRRLAALPGARVQGAHHLRRGRGREPARLADRRAPRWSPGTPRPRTKMGVTRTNGMPGLPGNNNFKVFEKPAPRRSATRRCHTGHMAINSADYDDRIACQQTGFCFQGCKWGAKWSTLYTEIPQGEETGNLEVRPDCHGAADRARRQRQGDRRRLCRHGRQSSSGRRRGIVAVAGNSIESPRLLLNSASSMFPDGLANSSGQVGRNYMRHMTGSVYGVFEQAGAHVARHDHGRHRPRRGAARPDARLRRRLRARDAVARPAVHGGLPRPGRLGPRVHLGARQLREHGRHVDRRRGHAAGDQPRHPRRRGEGPVRPAGRRTCTSTTTPTTSRCATTPTSRAIGDLRGGRRDADLPDAALSLDAQSRHQPDERERRATASSTSGARRHDIANLFVSDGSQFTTGAAENPTLTIVALAIRQADHIAGELGKGNI